MTNQMNNDLFSRQKLTDVVYVAESEEFTQEVKSVEELFKEDYCDGFFEILQGRFREMEKSENPNPENILSGLHNCKFVFKSLNILGEYYSELKGIKYYKQTPETLEVVKIHERFHAIHHLTTDKKGIWTDFSVIDSFYLELLAELFTYIYIRDCEASLIIAFENLNKNQPFIYRTFNMFRHYDQYQAEKLYWDIRSKSKANPVLKALRQILTLLPPKPLKQMASNPIKQLISQPINQMAPKPIKKIVPATELRHYYKFMSQLKASTETQRNILNDQLRGNNFNNIVKLYHSSYDHIKEIYNNPNEPIFDITRHSRKTSSGVLPAKSIKSDEDVISVFLNSKQSIVLTNPIYNFEYIEREISPLRTTNAIHENGKSANKSGTGGIDFIGWNLNNNIPILGEIKVNNDQNPFYALIQLLTYLSEISTPNQIDRLNNFPLFTNILPANSLFYLYIFSCRTKNQLGKYDKILPGTKTLAGKLVGVGGIKQIKEIVFLHMDPITKIITQE